MEDKNKTCSKKLHEKIEAIIYCQECKIYMCDKCKQLHSDLFDSHNIINLETKINDTQNMVIPNGKYEKYDSKFEKHLERVVPYWKSWWAIEHPYEAADNYEFGRKLRTR